MFGETWAAPIRSVKAEDVRATVEKEIAKKEHALKKAKANKRRLTPGAPPEQSTPVIAVDDDAWSIPSDDERPAPSNAKSKAVKDTSESDAATAARKAARELAAAWKKEGGKATKVLQSVTSIFSSLTSLTAKVEKNPDMISEDLTTGLQEAKTKIEDYKKRSSVAYIPFFIYMSAFSSIYLLSATYGVCSNIASCETSRRHQLDQRH